MSKQAEQPPAYESISLEPNSNGDQPPPIGFTCPQPGAAYPATQQLHNMIQAAPLSNVVHVQQRQRSSEMRETKSNVEFKVSQSFTARVVYAITPGPLPMGPARVTCQSCHEVVTTRVENIPSTQTHIIALLCCLLGLWPCCLLPYCIDSCMSTMHYCPKCGVVIGQGVNI